MKNLSERNKTRKEKTQLRRKKTQFEKIKRKWVKNSFSGFFKVSKKNKYLNITWVNNWKNLQLQHIGFAVYKLILKYIKSQDLYINYFFLRISHENVKIFANSLGPFRPYHTLKYLESFEKETLQKKRLYNIASFVCDYTYTRKVVLNLGFLYLPKTFGSKKVSRFFGRYRHERFFWESLQLVFSVFKGLASSAVLGCIVVSHIKRNPKRLQFISYIKRLLDWYFNTKKFYKIEGVRLEIKGRFNAKSRKKKHILSVGRLRIHEKSSFVDYSIYCTHSKFGAINVKVWICPLLKKLHLKAVT